MLKPFLALIPLAALGVVFTGCGSKTAQASNGQTPEDFLKWSMDQYHHAKSFSTSIDFKINSDGFGMKGERTRTFTYQSPNMYRVVTTLLPTKTTLTCVSDGKTETDYSDNIKAKAMTSTSPNNIHDVSSAPMGDPTVSGSVIYHFFGGSENIGLLEKQGDEKATWGPDGSAPSGETTKTVRFMSTGSFGHTEAVIGTKTGLVYRITFDSQPIVDQLLRGHTRQDAIDELKKNITTVPKGPKHDLVQKAIDKGPAVFDITGVETFTNPTFDAPVELAMFKAQVPAGEKFAPPPPDGKAPVAIGSRAPDITVTDSSGTPVKLSSLKGHVVLIDFWATWCGPCKEGLPVNSALADKYAGQGLKVIAISSEKAATVSAFVKQQSYKLAAYLDPEQAATYAYHVKVLPTTVIIDAKGNLSDYITGLEDPATLQASLARAGLKV